MAVKNNKLSVLLAVLLVVVGWLAFNMFSELKRVENAKQSIKQSTQTTTEQSKEVKLATPEEILTEVNQLRAEAGVSPVRLDERLNQSARLKVQDMIDNNYYAHENPTTGKSGPTYIFSLMNECRTGGENLYTRGNNSSARQIITEWAMSEKHYSAIIDPGQDLIGYANAENSKTKSTYDVLHLCKLKK